jgi:hypothetical protein
MGTEEEEEDVEGERDNEPDEKLERTSSNDANM